MTQLPPGRVSLALITLLIAADVQAKKSTPELPLAEKTETAASVRGQLAVGVQQQRCLH